MPFLKISRGQSSDILAFSLSLSTFLPIPLTWFFYMNMNDLMPFGDFFIIIIYLSLGLKALVTLPQS